MPNYVFGIWRGLMPLPWRPRDPQTTVPRGSWCTHKEQPWPEGRPNERLVRSRQTTTDTHPHKRIGCVLQGMPNITPSRLTYMDKSRINNIPNPPNNPNSRFYINMIKPSHTHCCKETISLPRNALIYLNNRKCFRNLLGITLQISRRRAPNTHVHHCVTNQILCG